MVENFLSSYFDSPSRRIRNAIHEFIESNGIEFKQISVRTGRSEGKIEIKIVLKENETSDGAISKISEMFKHNPTIKKETEDYTNVTCKYFIGKKLESIETL